VEGDMSQLNAIEGRNLGDDQKPLHFGVKESLLLFSLN